MRFVVVISSLAVTVYSAAQQYCTGFEAPLLGFTPSLKVTSHYENTSVLLFHLMDLLDGYRATVDLDVAVPLPERVFGRCCKDATTDTCQSRERFDPDLLLTVTGQFEVINDMLSPGQSVEYDVTESGIYCAYVHQMSTEKIEGVEFEASHLYGSGPMTSYYFLKLVVAFLIWLWFVLVFVRQMFPDMHDVHWNESLATMLKYGLLGKLTRGSARLVYNNFALMFNSVAYNAGFQTSSNFEPSIVLVNKWILIDHFLSLLTTTAVYRILACIFLFKKDEDLEDMDHPESVALEEPSLKIGVFYLPLGFVLIEGIPLWFYPDSSSLKMVTGDLFAGYLATLWSFICIYSRACCHASYIRKKPNKNDGDSLAVLGPLPRVSLTIVYALFYFCGSIGILTLYLFLGGFQGQKRGYDVGLGYLWDVRDSYHHMLSLNYIWNMTSSIIRSFFK